MYYDFIEIGTSDFDTLIQTCSDEAVGLTIEPIVEYLNALPDKPNVKKLNVAVSDRTGEEISVFGIPPAVIAMYNFPSWVRGCNSVGKHHPTVVKLLQMNNLPINMIKELRVSVVNMETIITENNVTGIGYLKTDTEGHDCVILNSFMDFCETERLYLLPAKVEFESNSLSLQEDVDKIIARFLKLGYIVESSGHDTILVRP